jgi:putative DNA primase/helicase
LKEGPLEEAEGILIWCIEGSMKYRAYGLQIPRSIQEETESYRKENDGIGCFLEKKCMYANGFSISKTKMQKATQGYCKENRFRKPNRTEISSYLKQRFTDVRISNGMF